jgi:1-acyl-sn-glycerol-3-phosphate acyltransferase
MALDLSRLDVIGTWAATTERELHAEPFQRDIAFLRRILPLMEIWSGYFDAEVRGFEHLPPQGPMLLVGNHSGGILTPDTAVFFAAWYRARGLDDPLIGLAFDGAFGIPWFRDLMRRIGEVPAKRENARRALAAGHAVLVYPGGDHECFRPWTDRNRVDFAGRQGFVELALRERVPVVPVVAHGGHHSIFILTRGDWLGPLIGSTRIRTTTFPWALQVPWGLSPINVPGIPFPAKVTTQICRPMPWSVYGPEAADDPAIVERCYHEITGAMQATLDRLVAERPYPVLSRLRRLLPGSR